MYKNYSNIHIEILEYFKNLSQYIKEDVFINSPINQMLNILSNKEDYDMYKKACIELCNDGLLDNILNTLMKKEGLLIPRITEKGENILKKHNEI